VTAYVGRADVGGTMGGDNVLPEADARSIKLLLEKHADSIHMLREHLKDDFAEGGPEIEDMNQDIRLLKYCMSFDKHSDRVMAIRKSLTMRRDPVLSKPFRTALDLAKKYDNDYDKITYDDLAHVVVCNRISQKFSCNGSVDMAKDDTIVVVVRNVPGVSSAKMMDRLPINDMVEDYLTKRELIYRKMEASAKRTGRLVKLLIFMDLTNTPMGELKESRSVAMFKRLSSYSGYLFPQLMHKMVMLNSPTWMYGFFTILKQVFPKRMTEKIELSPKGRKLAETDLGSQWINPDKIPAFLAGGRPDTELPASLTGELLGDDASTALDTTDIKAGKVKTLNLDVPTAGTTFAYRFSVQSTSLRVKAVFKAKATQGETVLFDETKAFEDGAVAGEVVLPENQQGHVEVCFINSHAKLRGKTIFHRFEIIS